MIIYIHGIEQAEIRLSKIIVDQYALLSLRLAFAMAFNCHIEEVEIRL